MVLLLSFILDDVPSSFPFRFLFLFLFFFFFFFDVFNYVCHFNFLPYDVTGKKNSITNFSKVVPFFSDLS